MRLTRAWDKEKTCTTSAGLFFSIISDIWVRNELAQADETSAVKKSPMNLMPAHAMSVSVLLYRQKSENNYSIKNRMRRIWETPHPE
jgi:hypothetical protein